MARTSKSRNRTRDKLGVWMFGALGGLATTAVVGARAIARGKTPPRGMLTETDLFLGADLVPVSDLVFGGHEIRSGDWTSAAEEMDRLNGTLPAALRRDLHEDLRSASRNLRRGIVPNAGETIEKLADRTAPEEDLQRMFLRVRRDLRSFVSRNHLRDCVCVNLTSTEPPLRPAAAHRTPEAFERAIAADRRSAVRPAAVYAFAAASLGMPFLNFTPSEAALIPAIRLRFERNGAPYAGSDGKTGETLVKSALAPMFKYRNLRVLAWQGYNILGDRDGLVLDDERNKASKIRSKDALLQAILGYPLHTHVGIDYVPSLQDHKTAWDFIHFEGFLGHRMAMQFLWHGCDSILAAPLVLDLVRLLDLAHRRGENGPQHHLACFFKRPIDLAEHDLHEQWHRLVAYAEAVRGG
ncbi:MAG: inositol-3-phosphate synthase [Planctomycetota bacterium]